MQDQTTSAIEMRRSGARIVGFGIGGIIAILAMAAALLFWALPDANAFNAKVERLFIENDDLTAQAEIKLLEILEAHFQAFYFVSRQAFKCKLLLFSLF